MQILLDLPNSLNSPYPRNSRITAILRELRGFSELV